MLPSAKAGDSLRVEPGQRGCSLSAQWASLLLTRILPAGVSLLPYSTFHTALPPTYSLSAQMSGVNALLDGNESFLVEHTQSFGRKIS